MKKISNLAEIFMEVGNQSWNGITFVDAQNDSYLSYESLLKKSGRLLAVLQENNVRKGNEVLIPEGIPRNFVIAFWACILGGLIPVPLPVQSSSEQANNIAAIWNMMDNPFLLADHLALKTTVPILEKYGADFRKIGSRFFEFDDDAFDYEKAPDYTPNKILPDDTAIIQFSSGSTGIPKGSVITNTNMIAEIKAMVAKAHINKNDKFLSWQPLTHVMGLIGYHVMPLIGNIDQAIMDSKLFVINPLLWLQKASDYSTTLTSSPNFGLQHCFSLCFQ